jgi:hypothetical protein
MGASMGRQDIVLREKISSIEKEFHKKSHTTKKWYSGKQCCVVSDGKLFLQYFDRALAVGLLVLELTCGTKVGL